MEHPITIVENSSDANCGMVRPLSPQPSWMQRFVGGGVAFYQRFLSPYKGFSCAHRILYGGLSCSEFFRITVRRDGVLPALLLLKQRFRACTDASIILKAQRIDRRERESERSPYCGDLTCSLAEIPCGLLSEDACDPDCCADADLLSGCDGLDCGSGCDVFSFQLNKVIRTPRKQ